MAIPDVPFTASALSDGACDRLTEREFHNYKLGIYPKDKNGPAKIRAIRAAIRVELIHKRLQLETNYLHKHEEWASFL